MEDGRIDGLCGAGARSLAPVTRSPRLTRTWVTTWRMLACRAQDITAGRARLPAAARVRVFAGCGVAMRKAHCEDSARAILKGGRSMSVEGGGGGGGAALAPETRALRAALETPIAAKRRGVGGPLAPPELPEPRHESCSVSLRRRARPQAAAVLLCVPAPTSELLILVLCACIDAAALTLPPSPQLFVPVPPACCLFAHHTI